MKFALALIALAGFASSAHAAVLEGRFAEKKYVVDYDLSGDEAECKRYKGIYEDGMCMSPVKDTAKIKKTPDGYDVAVGTWGNDLDGCSFEGKGKLTSENVITASQVTDRYVDGEWKDNAGLCSITVTVADDILTVTDPSEDCETLCGMHAQLWIEKAKRVRPRTRRP